MVVVENLIVKGKYFFPAKVDQVGSLKDTLQEYLVKKMYEPEDARSLFFRDRFLTANYKLFFGKPKVSLKSELRLRFGIISEEEIHTQLYFKKLRSIRKEIPFTIKISLSLQKFKETEGIVIEVMSKPVAYYLITQLNKNLDLDKTAYSLIKHENTEFIRELMASIHAQCITEPDLLSSYIQTEVSQKLRVYKFDKIASLLDKGKKRLETGENAIGDLLGVIENFLFELVKMSGSKPAGLQHPQKNISKLRGLGFLTGSLEGTIQSSLYHSVYSKLKDFDHKKEEIDYFDMLLYYGITEAIIDYLIDKVVKYKIKKFQNTTISSNDKNS